MSIDKFNYHEDEDKRVHGERHAGIVVKDGTILLIHRIKKGDEYYVFPGGHRQEGEIGEETVVREVYEETGMTVKVTGNAFIRKNDDLGHTDHYYLCDWTKGDEPQLLGEERLKHSLENHYDPMWMPLTEFQKLNILPKFAKNWLTEHVSKLG